MKILAKLIFEFLRLIFRSKQDIVLENLALRQQLAIQQLRETFAFDETTKYVIRDNDSPVHRPVQANGKIVSKPILGGLHHVYSRVA